LLCDRQNPPRFPTNRSWTSRHSPGTSPSTRHSFAASFTNAESRSTNSGSSFGSNQPRSTTGSNNAASTCTSDNPRIGTRTETHRRFATAVMWCARWVIAFPPTGRLAALASEIDTASSGPVVRLLDLHLTNNGCEIERLKLLDCFEDVVGLIWTCPLLTLGAVCALWPTNSSSRAKATETAKTPGPDLDPEHRARHDHLTDQQPSQVAPCDWRNPGPLQLADDRPNLAGSLCPQLPRRRLPAAIRQPGSRHQRVTSETTPRPLGRDRIPRTTDGTARVWQPSWFR